MKIKEIKDVLGLKLICGEEEMEREVKVGYCGDLLSDVMANAPDESIWITIQTHQNIVAVAVLKSMRGIIIAGNHQPDEDTIKKAEAEKLPIFVSPMTSFEIAGRLYESGIGKGEGV